MSDASAASSLTVQGGPFDGTQYLLDQAVDEILIGSDPGCQMFIDLPGVSPIHVRIWVDHNGVVAHDTKSPAGLFVNDVQVDGQAPLQDGDVLWLGPPNEEGSIRIQCRLAAAAVEEAPAVPMEWGDAAAPAEPAVIEEAPAASAPVDEFMVEPEAVAPAPDAAPFELETPAEAAPFELEAPAPAAPVEPEAPSFEAPSFEAPLELEGAALAPSPDEFMAEPAADAGDFMVEPESAPVLAEPEAAPILMETEAAPSFVETVPEPAAEDPVFVVDDSATEAPAPAAPAPPPPPAPPAAAAPAKAARPSPKKIDLSEAPSMAPSRERIAPVVGEMRASSARPAPVRKAPKAPGPPIGRYAAVAGIAVAVLGGGGFFLMKILSAPKVQGVVPPRAHAGQNVTISGAHFATEPGGNVVTIGDKTARILKATASEIQIEVPELPAPPGHDTKFPVKLRVAGRDTAGGDLAVYQSPRIHGMSPDVAMPGEEVGIAGTGWTTGATVSFGALPAEILSTTPTEIKVRVPAIEGGAGTAAQVAVKMGAETSNGVPFIVGHLPLVTSINPASASPGDAVTLSGRGFQLKVQDNLVRIGGQHALLVSSNGSELKVVVPRVASESGEAAVEIRVRGLENAGQATLKLNPPADPVELRLVPEPFDDEVGHDHVILSTELGPAFVVSASGGKSATERALDVQARWAKAVVALKASRDEAVDLRNLETTPTIALVTKGETLLEPLAEDAAGYDEDWTKLGSKAVPVSRGRLAQWWGAVARDLVLVLVRSEKPHFAADLAPEGKAFGELFAAAQKVGGFGVPHKVVLEMKPPAREALRVVGLRVPPTVAGPASGAAAETATALKIDGVWSGTENDGSSNKYINVNFKGGTFAFSGGLNISLPLLSVEQPQKGTMRFSLAFRGATRYYTGKWDGEKLRGTMSSDAAGKVSIGSFELAPAR